MLRPQQPDAPRAFGEEALTDDADIGEGRQQQQNMPPKKAGASCAIAAKDNRPIEASCDGPAAR